MDELDPLEPHGSTAEAAAAPSAYRRTWYAAALGLLGLLGSGLAIKHLHSRGNLESESVEFLTELIATSCGDVDCLGNFLGRNFHVATCDGDKDSLTCINTCCTEEVHCAALGSDFCSNLGAQDRIVTFLDRGMRLRTGRCRGEENCEDTCCQRFCEDIVCETGRCKRPFPPKKCTDSTCQEQCCYEPTEYCGLGFNAWTSACHECLDKTTWCANELSVQRSDYTIHQWNRLVFQEVEAGNLVPGCEENPQARCEDTILKYRLSSVFLLHQTAEGASANTVRVLPGGTEAISGGDDGQVWNWRLSDGRPLKNFTSDIEPIMEVAPLNDATYFCSVSKSQAIIWLLQLRDGLEVPGKTELPQDDRKGYTPPNNTACIGVNTWETVVVGQDNEFVVLWHWKLDRTMTVPVDPNLAWIQQIETDAGFHQWPSWDKQDKLQDAFVAWRKHLFGLDQNYNRRLEANNSADSPAPASPSEADTSTNLRRLKRSSGPWPNWFSNVRFRGFLVQLKWGDYPKWYYEPHGWGKVISLAAIPSNLYFVVGYEHGSIRVWWTYNGFIKAVIPKAHVGKVNALMPAPAGDTFWSGGDDGWIRQWEAGSGKPLQSQYAVYAGPTLALAMIPGGNAFYSGHADNVTLFWLVIETKWPLCYIDPGGGKVNSLDVNPGKIGQIAMALENGLIKNYEQR